MKKQPLVSIITVVYNGEKHLQQTIDSVYNQTYKNIQHIIIDGESTDNTLNIIKKNNTKISKWISEKDNGIYDAMNKGIKMADGLLVGILNSDDWFERDTVNAVVQVFRKNQKTHIIHGNRYDIKKDGTKRLYKFKPSIFKLKYLSMPFSHPAMFVHRSVYKNQLYSTNLKSYSDYLFVLKLVMSNNYNFEHLQVPLVNFRLEGASSKLSFFEELKEAYTMRKLAGFSLFQNLIATSIFILLFPLRFFKNLVD